MRESDYSEDIGWYIATLVHRVRDELCYFIVHVFDEGWRGEEMIITLAECVSR